MEKLIDPVDKQLILSELSSDTFVRITNYSKNEIHVLDHRNAPNTLREIGRLRELSFRASGGGTGKALDLDDYDLRKNPYQQLIVWNPEHQEICGGYRFFDCKKADLLNSGKPDITTAELFTFSDQYKEKYLPHTIELGRSFVQPTFQFKSSKATLFVLDNLWDGIGTVANRHSHIKYLFGKVSIYPSVDQKAISILLSFLYLYFGTEKKLVTAIEPYQFSNRSDLFKGNNFVHDFKILRQNLKNFDARIPPLINAYMKLSSTFKVFSTTVNTYFGGLIDSGIQITIDEIFEDKKKRYFSVK